MSWLKPALPPACPAGRDGQGRQATTLKASEFFRKQFGRDIQPAQLMRL
jgi:hypothetical protein